MIFFLLLWHTKNNIKFKSKEEVEEEVERKCIQCSLIFYDGVVQCLHHLSIVRKKVSRILLQFQHNHWNDDDDDWDQCWKILISFTLK